MPIQTAIRTAFGMAAVFAMAIGNQSVLAQRHGGHHGGSHGSHSGSHSGSHRSGHHGSQTGSHTGSHRSSHHRSYGHGSYGHYGYSYRRPSYYGYYSYPWYSTYYPRNTTYYRPTYPSQTYVETVPPVEPSPTLARTEPSAARRLAWEIAELKLRAKEAFRSGDYDSAIRLTKHGLVESPRDGRLHLLKAQALFAKSDYSGAAASIHQGVPLLEPHEWGYVVEHYKSYYRGTDYLEQMERLRAHIEQNPDAADARFVRGYQYGFLGYKEAAVRDFTKLVELDRGDELAAKLLEKFGGTWPEKPSLPPLPGPES